VEDVLAGVDWLPDIAELEYHRAIEAGTLPRLAVSPARDALRVWLLDGDRQRLASARLARLDGVPPPG
jgi:hypothetical protein